jgi:predicted nucleic acid-binding protein
MRDGKVFVDTNVLVYAYDKTAGVKHDGAAKIMRELWDNGRGVISIQVLQEFFVTVTGKIAKPLDTLTAREVVRDLLKWNPVVTTGDILIEAIDIHAAHKYSLWDSLIIASAIEGGAATLLSEDLSDRHSVKNMVVRNPFKLHR